MNEQTFKLEMTKAMKFLDLGENKEYWRGYIRGLRRNYHGEDFGTLEEHKKWLSLIDDKSRKELGRGYRDALAKG